MLVVCLLAVLGMASAGVMPFCTDIPTKDEMAIEACNFLIDANSNYIDCIEIMTLEDAKETFRKCLVDFCSIGDEGVCEYAIEVRTICGETYSVDVGQLPEGCEEPTTTTSATTVSSLCHGFSGQDEDAIEACSFIIDSSSEFFACTDTFTLEEAKKWFLECTELYCTEGMSGVCDLADRLATECEPVVVITGRPEDCAPTTTTTTTAMPTACTPNNMGDAIEACDFVVDAESEYFGCTGDMGTAVVKSWLRNCTETYCLTGQPSLCDVANRLAHICEASGHGVITQRPTGCICSLQYLDIVFVIDTSLSVDVVELQKMREFISAVANAFDIGDSTSRVGIVNYADDVKVEVDLESSNSNPEITQIAMTLTRRPCFGACTWTPAGLDHMSDMFNNQGSGSPQVGILLTDGFSNIGNLPNAISNIPSSVKMFAVGVVAASHAQLLEIAGGNADRVFEVTDFDGLAAIIGTLKEEICI